MAEDKRTSEKLVPANYYQGCIYAWNAYREGRAISAIKYKTDKGLHQAAE
jgi:hypothetical protein